MVARILQVVYKDVYGSCVLGKKKYLEMLTTHVNQIGPLIHRKTCS